MLYVFISSKNNILKEKFENLKRSTQQQTPSEQYRGLASTNNTKSKQTLDAMQINTDIDYSSRNENASPQVEYLDTNTNTDILMYFNFKNEKCGYQSDEREPIACMKCSNYGSGYLI